VNKRERDKFTCKKPAFSIRSATIFLGAGGFLMVEVNATRRRFLVASTAVVAGAGVVGVAIPFLGSWKPSAKAKAAGAPVKYDLAKLQPGDMVTVEWRGKPVYVVRRTREILDSLAKNKDLVRDPESEEQQQPDYAKNATRSIQEEYLVVVGLCTHLGCAPKGRFQPGVNPATGGEDSGWPGGFFCPCHGSKFDLAGRVFKGVPAPTNLVVPPHRFDNTILIIGEEGGQQNA
jgi:ubiquinol-cytochrome c reductase iron-sulfur subunit